MHQKEIYQQYKDKVNNTEEKNNKINLLKAKKREIRLQLNQMMIDLKSSEDLQQRDKIMREYIRVNKMFEINEQIREIHEEPILNTIVLSIATKPKDKKLRARRKRYIAS